MVVYLVLYVATPNAHKIKELDKTDVLPVTDMDGVNINETLRT
jgi:hypothetical protein